jgi:hypothetical protein
MQIWHKFVKNMPKGVEDALPRKEKEEKTTKEIVMANGKKNNLGLDPEKVKKFEQAFGKKPKQPKKPPKKDKKQQKSLWQRVIGN